MTAKRSEIDQTFDVAMNTPVPSMLGLPRVARVEQVLASTLETVYCDTGDLALADAGITLRRRTGGSDAGWHLRLPLCGDDRAELDHPLADDHQGVPPELLGRVRAWVRGSELRTVATLSTHRVVHRLIGERQTVLAELSDDVVTANAVPQAGEAVISTWREWAIELVDGPRKLRRAADDLLTAAGATASTWPSALHRAADRRPPARPPATSALDEKSTAGVVLIAYLAEQVAEILGRDGDVRRGEPDAIHRMRVACRRLRSVLASFGPTLEREGIDPLREELRWLATTLGGARDVEVQRDHLQQALSAEAPDLVLGPVAARIEVELDSDLRVARQALLGEMESSRYFGLLDRLDAVISTPLTGDFAMGKSRPLMRSHISQACKTLHALVSQKKKGAHQSQDVWLHDVRKAAKRVRYAAEVGQPVLGRSAAALVAATAEVQEILGEHQDSVVVRETLHGIAGRMFSAGENVFTIGRLHALQQTRGEAAERAFLLLWSDGVAEQVRGWKAR